MTPTYLEAARQVFQQKGARLTLSDIAGAAGVSRTTIHKHLGTKAAILARLNSPADPSPAEWDVEARIMHGVLEVAARRGFKAASIEAIARAAGVGPATIYRRYATKDALVRAFISRQTPRDKLPDLPRDASIGFDAQLRLITRQLLDFMLGNQTLVRLVFSGSVDDRAYLDGLRDASHSTFSRLTGFFRDQQARGAIRADLRAEDLTTCLFGMIHAHAVIAPSGQPPDPERVTDTICALFTGQLQGTTP